ncbi:MAG: fumarylacetoacetate hydrolase family protein [Cyclobacteriaceae bacterium]
MKILCIGRNYVDHIKELNNEKPDAPVIFIKPDSAILRLNQPFYYPDFTKDIHHEIEVVVKFNAHGKNIQRKFAHKYYDEIGLGVDLTARDLQSQFKAKGLPWELAKGFNGSAPVSKFFAKKDYDDIQNLDFRLEINGEIRQQGNTQQMIYPIDEIIEYVSKFITIKKGDLLFTGTPKGVGPIAIGDNIKGYLAGEKLLDFNIK